MFKTIILGLLELIFIYLGMLLILIPFLRTDPNAYGWAVTFTIIVFGLHRVWKL